MDFCWVITNASSVTNRTAMPDLYSLILTAVDALKKRGGLATVKTNTFYARALNEGCVVVDLGANVGEFASAITTRFDGVTCHALEAVSSIFCQIPNTAHVQKYNLAISDRDGPVHLFVSTNRECNSIHGSIAATYARRSVEVCAGVTLQNFLDAQRIERIDLLKVDIEGSEELLFDSTQDRVLRNIRQITIEFHDFVPGSISSEAVSRIVTRLRSLGFYCIPFSYIYPDMLNADLHFIQCKACNVSLGDRACFLALRTILRLEKAKSGMRSGARHKRLRTHPESLEL